MPTDELTARAPRRQDVDALIGVLATLEGQLMADDQDLPDWAARIASRLIRDGFLAEPSNRAMRQSLNDLNHRLRDVLGEYGDPVVADPVL